MEHDEYRAVDLEQCTLHISQFPDSGEVVISIDLRSVGLKEITIVKTPGVDISITDEIE